MRSYLAVNFSAPVDHELKRKESKILAPNQRNKKK